jgi:ABC-type multidrug transport system ATPase subunit
VTLAEALVHGRPLTILDEPFAAFDPLQLREALAVIRSLTGRGSAFLVSMHQIEQAARVADRCVLLSEGSVLAAGDEAQLREAAGVPEAELDEVVVALLRRARSPDAA